MRPCLSIPSLSLTNLIFPDLVIVQQHSFEFILEVATSQSTRGTLTIAPTEPSSSL